MSIYCPFAEALGIDPGERSILDIPSDHLNEYGCPIPPWNKGKKGLQENPFKGTTGRYSEKTLKLISKNTKKAMTKLSPVKKKEMLDRNTKNGLKCWIHNSEGTHKRVDKEELQKYLTNGWNRGRLLPHDPKSGRFYKQ